MDDQDLKKPIPIKDAPKGPGGLAQGTAVARDWLHRQPRWSLIAVPAALVVGVLLGSLAFPSPNPRTTDEYLALRDRTSEELKNMRERADERQDKIGELTRNLRTYENMEDDLEEAAEAAAAKEAELAAMEAELAARESAVGSAEAAAKANQFENGIHLVGSDIQAGTYRSDGGSLCYWARLSGLSGDMNELLANGIADGQAVVTIASGDAAFESKGCSTWTKIG